VSEHDQFRELIEAYALGALDANERAALEAHLASGCTECGKALEEARLVVTQLAYLAPPAEPSDMLRARVLRTVRADAAASGGGGSLPMQAGGSQRSSIPMWLWAGVAALLIVSVYSTWEAGKMRQQVTEMNQRLAAELKERKQREEELTLAKHEAWILTDPNSKKIKIMPNDKSMPMVEAVWHPKMGIYVMAQQMPMPKDNKVLQLWLIPKNGTKPMPSHVFWPDASGKIGEMVANPPEDMAETKALAITEEPPGGSLQPTSTPMWVGGVS
jgi:anti-sigma-K factor RskA